MVVLRNGDFLTVCCFKELSQEFEIDNAYRIFRQFFLPRTGVNCILSRHILVFIQTSLSFFLISSQEIPFQKRLVFT